MSEYYDHRDDCPFKFATLDVCDCVEKNMLDRIEALTAKVKLMDDLDAINGEKIEALTAELNTVMDNTVAELEAKLAECEARLGKAVETLDRLVALNDDYSPFGGEMFQDRVERTWQKARTTLEEISRPTKGVFHD